MCRNDKCTTGYSYGNPFFKAENGKATLSVHDRSLTIIQGIQQLEDNFVSPNAEVSILMNY